MSISHHRLGRIEDLMMKREMIKSVALCWQDKDGSIEFRSKTYTNYEELHREYRDTLDIVLLCWQY